MLNLLFTWFLFAEESRTSHLLSSPAMFAPSVTSHSAGAPRHRKTAFNKPAGQAGLKNLLNISGNKRKTLIPALVAVEWASLDIAPQIRTSVPASTRQAIFSVAQASGNNSCCSEQILSPSDSYSRAFPVTSNTGDTLSFHMVIAVFMVAPTMVSAIYVATAGPKLAHAATSA